MPQRQQQIQRRRSKKGQCRFCLEDDVVQNLIAPCVCTGTSKYIHNACLINWYNHQPTKGLICSVCKVEFARKFNIRDEPLPTHEMLEMIPLQHPLYTIIGNHFMLFGFMYGIAPVIIPYKNLVYHMYQLVYHAYYLWEFSVLVNNVRDTSLYWRMWRKDFRYILPIAHLSFLLSIGKTYWVSGMSADICMLVYFFEHLEILSQLNTMRTFMFVNYPQDAAALAQE
jgi:hypothetical protein